MLKNREHNNGKPAAPGMQGNKAFMEKTGVWDVQGGGAQGAASRLKLLAVGMDGERGNASPQPSGALLTLPLQRGKARG